jgi:hypothetical protein
MTGPQTEAEDRCTALLHWPGRKDHLLSLEEHLDQAASMARMLWLSLEADVDLKDPRDAAALRSLASLVADHASAAEYLLAIRGRQ